jgi:FixJ family two-component response regulator
MCNVQGTVFIVDDDAEVRASLSRLLTSEGYQVRTFESAVQFLGEQDADTPGCLLLDLCMPDLSGIELQRALDGSPGARPVVFLTAMGDIETSVEAMKAGAVDFLTKPFDSAKLLATVERALRRDIEQRHERAIRTAIEQRLKNLTRREREVMAHVIRGRLNKQIAAEMHNGEKTVKIHRRRVMSKMRARTVPELVYLAVRAGVAPEFILRD